MLLPLAAPPSDHRTTRSPDNANTAIPATTTHAVTRCVALAPGYAPGTGLRYGRTSPPRDADMLPIRTHRYTPGQPPLALACVFAVALAGCQARTQVPDAGASPGAASPDGVYAMPAPLTSELRVVALPGRSGEYRIEVHGAGDPGDGAGAGADCRAVAEGPLVAGHIDAALLPFESAAGGLDESDLQAAPRLRLTLHDDTATLEGAFGHCPMATAMAGSYRKTTTARLLVDCAPLPAACWNRD